MKIKAMKQKIEGAAIKQQLWIGWRQNTWTILTLGKSLCAGICSLHAVELYFAADLRLSMGSSYVGVLGALNLVELVHLPPSSMCYTCYT